MKRITTLTVVAMLCGPACLCSADLVGYWSFNNPLDPGHDDSGHSNHATLTGTTWIPGGKVGGALEFDGSSSKGVVSDSASLSTVSANRALTIDVHFNIDSIIQNPPSDENPIVGKWGPGGDGDDEWQLYIRASTGRLEFHLNSGTAHGSPDTVLLSPYSLDPSLDVWHHAVAIWDGNAGRAALYLDEVLVDSTSSAIISMPDTSQPLTMGYGHFGTTSYGYFDGMIDQVKVYNYAVPAPGAVILGSIGLSFSGWLLRRRKAF
jgi:hypothetical protein